MDANLPTGRDGLGWLGRPANEQGKRVSIEVCNESGVPVDESLLASVARYVLDAMHVNPAAELSILAVTEDVMSELHQRWMDEPGPTDVMSFPMDELVEESRRPDAPETGPALLGDIVLCPDFAKAQARTAGHGLADELHLLTVHGVLHLLGYDHAEPEQEREMFGLQDKLLGDWRTAREQAAARAAQHRSDSAVLGVAGLEDGSPDTS
jgi:probable rRNA maturation factor